MAGLTTVVDFVRRANALGHAGIRVVAVAVTCAVLTACGGGGSSSSGGNPGAPTVTIGVSPASIALGESATLTWSSTGATSCTGSGGDAGSGWNGSQRATSGQVSVGPAAEGTYVYTLNCSGSGGSASASTTLRVSVAALPQQIAAAQATATSSAACRAISANTAASGLGDDGFYWEIGDQDGIVVAGGLTAAGTVAPPGGTNYTRDSAMAIASATKWMYGAYVVEKRGSVVGDRGRLAATDVPYLNLTSGYDNMSDVTCAAIGVRTIGDCLDASNERLIDPVPNGTQTAADVGRFLYNSGHLEKFEGSVMNGAGRDIFDLSAQMVDTFRARGVTLEELPIPVPGEPRSLYILPITAGGVYTNAANYAAFLQGIVRTSNPLLMRYFLNPTASDAYAVCTNPATCGDAIGTPTPASVSWHYSITHWIEDDPVSGDGAYSSPGKNGFYPWIDASRTYYGIVSRYDNNQSLLDPENAPYFKSAACGAAIRRAFLTGVALD